MVFPDPEKLQALASRASTAEDFLCRRIYVDILVIVVVREVEAVAITDHEGIRQLPAVAYFKPIEHLYTDITERAYPSLKGVKAILGRQRRRRV